MLVKDEAKYGVVFVILHLAILIKHRLVMDGRTYRTQDHHG